jgi:hypothetical protein
MTFRLFILKRHFLLAMRANIGAKLDVLHLSGWVFGMDIGEHSNFYRWNEGLLSQSSLSHCSGVVSSILMVAFSFW